MNNFFGRLARGLFSAPEQPKVEEEVGEPLVSDQLHNDIKSALADYNGAEVASLGLADNGNVYVGDMQDRDYIYNVKTDTILRRW